MSYVILEPTPRPYPGRVGELCIAGCHLARGYRNLPGVTAERFIDHPTYGRLYRTGDRCRIDPISNQVEFGGRLDAQLKVRGHRVEAQGIESFLQDQIEEIESAVVTYRDDELIAHVIAPGRATFTTSDAPVQAAATDWTQTLQFQLRQHFPEYAVPARFFLMREFPLKPLSGKIDREQLPEPPKPPASSKRHPRPTAQTDDTAGADAAVLAICRRVLGDHLQWDDDFVEWGAHSIAMAKLTHALRTEGYRVSVRDLLTDFRTARRAAQLPKSAEILADKETAQGEPGQSAPSPQHVLSTLDTRLFTLLQGLALLLLRLPTLLVLVLLIVLGDPEDALVTGDTGTLLTLTFLAYLAYLATPFFNLLWVKVLNTVTPGAPVDSGRYPRWSKVHWRVWWLECQQRSVLQPMNAWLRAPGIHAWLLRQLGARRPGHAHLPKHRVSGPPVPDQAG